MQTQVIGDPYHADLIVGVFVASKRWPHGCSDDLVRANASLRETRACTPINLTNGKCENARAPVAIPELRNTFRWPSLGVDRRTNPLKSWLEKITPVPLRNITIVSKASSHDAPCVVFLRVSSRRLNCVRSTVQQIPSLEPCQGGIVGNCQLAKFLIFSKNICNNEPDVSDAVVERWIWNSTQGDAEYTELQVVNREQKRRWYWKIFPPATTVIWVSSWNQYISNCSALCCDTQSDISRGVSPKDRFVEMSCTKPANFGQKASVCIQIDQVHKTENNKWNIVFLERCYTSQKVLLYNLNKRHSIILLKFELWNFTVRGTIEKEVQINLHLSNWQHHRRCWTTLLGWFCNENTHKQFSIAIMAHAIVARYCR